MMCRFLRVVKLGGFGELVGILFWVGVLIGCVGSLGFCMIFVSVCILEWVVDVNVIN